MTDADYIYVLLYERIDAYNQVDAFAINNFGLKKRGFLIGSLQDTAWV